MTNTFDEWLEKLAVMPSVGQVGASLSQRDAMMGKKDSSYVTTNEAIAKNVSKIKNLEEKDTEKTPFLRKGYNLVRRVLTGKKAPSDAHKKRTRALRSMTLGEDGKRERVRGGARNRYAAIMQGNINRYTPAERKIVSKGGFVHLDSNKKQRIENSNTVNKLIQKYIKQDKKGTLSPEDRAFLGIALNAKRNIKEKKRWWGEHRFSEAPETEAEKEYRFRHSKQTDEVKRYLNKNKKKQEKKQEKKKKKKEAKNKQPPDTEKSTNVLRGAVS